MKIANRNVHRAI